MQFLGKTITKIYMGKDRACRCGCAGTYTYPNSPLFAKRVARFQYMWDDYVPTVDDMDDSYVNLSYGKNRALTVYFD